MPVFAYSLQLWALGCFKKGPPRKRQPDLHFMKQSGCYSRLSRKAGVQVTGYQALNAAGSKPGDR